MFTSYHNNSCDNNMVVVDDDEQNMFENRPFENDISPNYKPDSLSFSFFHFSPATTFFDQDDAFLQYHSHLLQQSVVVDSSPADSITTTTMAAENQTQTTKMAATPSPSDNNDPSSNEPNKNKTSSMKTRNKNTTTTSSSTKKIPKRRLAGKKDRHSKIVTAQGPRDRRMRLSLPIAREFFSLQDMLGVDKPSKTVQWLLTMSKSAIEELTISMSQRRRINNNNKYHSAGTGGNGSKSNTTGSPPMSECEVVSQIEETSVDAYNHDRRSADFSKRKSMESSSPSTTTHTKGKKIKPSRKITCHHPLTRESRAKARARARERTIEKNHSQSKQCVRENLDNDLNKARSLTITSKEGEESAGSATYDMKSTLELVTSTDEVMKHSSPSTEHQGSLVKDSINVVDLEESFMITTRKASSNSIFSYHDDIGLIGNSNNSTSVLNFSEMWDFTNNNAGQTNFSYCAIADMNLPAGNIQEYCLPSSSTIPLASPNTRLQSQFANPPLFCGKP